VPESPSPDAHRPARTADERSADHAAIDRLSVELLPSLIAKLGATHLGELEVREGAWRVRLQRPGPDGSGSGGHSGASTARERRPADRTGERGATERTDRHPERGTRSALHGPDGGSARSASRGVATSPAVGIYRPRTDLSAGDRVRSGDRLGAVDMLGVAQEVLSPVDGIIGSALAESGDAVEYGQELLAIEIIAAPAPSATATNGSGG
jgi:biotin carboxyl carrier protein